MPSPENVISGLAELAQQWRWLAAAWHVALGAVLIAFYAGWRPTTRTFLVALVVPLISVRTSPGCLVIHSMGPHSGCWRRV